MADGKLTYDIDFNVNADSISDAIARAVAGVTSSVTYSKPSTASIDAALANLGDRLKAGKSFYGRVARNLGFGDKEHPQYEFFQGQGVNSLADFASLATSQKYGYTPSTTQTIINSAVASALHKSKKKPDMQWKFEMESLTNDIRAAQREQNKASLAYEYSQQGAMFANAAAVAGTPEAQKMLLGRAANRYASIASRTLIEAGAVTPDDAAIALSTAADLGAIRSGIKTTSQLAAAREKDYERMEAIKAREEAFVSKKAAQEDAAWATRDYSEDRKQRDMEKGFRAMEAHSATEAAYNVDRDPDVARWNYGAGLYSAAQYAEEAKKYPAGSAGRAANIELAKESMRGITISGMAKSGMHKDELARNTTALLGLTALLKDLSGSGEGGGGGSGASSNKWKLISTVLGTAMDASIDIMEGRTQWLADMSTPYQTRRDVRQGWAKSYGKATKNIGLGAMAAGGAALGAGAAATAAASAGLIGAGAAATASGIGAAVGVPLLALGGLAALGGYASEAQGTHFADEKKIGMAIQDRMVDMAKYRALYGSGVEYNYAQLIENMGYASTGSVLGLNQAAGMLPGAMMFGAVSEQQMMALSYMPDYYAALLEGRSTSEILDAYKRNIMNLPVEMRQYITSLLPGMSEDLRAFAMSGETYDVARGLSGRMREYDTAQVAMSPGWVRGRNYSAAENQRWVQKNILEETATASAPNYYRTREEWAAAMAESYNEGAFTPTTNSVTRALDDVTRMLQFREFKDGRAVDGKLGDIIINIDGNTIYNEGYHIEDFEKSNQTYVIGGV